MRPTKWAQSIECRGDKCFICILPFLAWRQIFLLFLGLCLMVHKTGPRPFRGHVNILGVLGYCNFLVLVMSCLYFSWGLAISAFWGLLSWHWTPPTCLCPWILILPPPHPTPTHTHIYFNETGMFCFFWLSACIKNLYFTFLCLLFLIVLWKQ